MATSFKGMVEMMLPLVLFHFTITVCAGVHVSSIDLIFVEQKEIYNLCFPAGKNVSDIEMEFIRQHGGFEVKTKHIPKYNIQLHISHLMSNKDREINNANYVKKNNFTCTMYLSGYSTKTFFKKSAEDIDIAHLIIGMSNSNDFRKPEYLEGVIKLVARCNVTYRHTGSEQQSKVNKELLLTGPPVIHEMSAVNDSLLSGECGIQLGESIRGHGSGIHIIVYTRSSSLPHSRSTTAAPNLLAPTEPFEMKPLLLSTITAYVYVSTIMTAFLITTTTWLLFKLIATRRNQINSVTLNSMTTTA